ncbi:MAG: pilin [Methylococcaceae bacterium]
MQQKFRVLLCGLLLISHCVIADNRAVNISVTNNNSADKLIDINSIQTTVGQAVSTNIVDTLLIYQPLARAKNKFYACVQATDNSSAEQFKTFINTLRNLSLSENSRYQLKVTQRCMANETLACVANPNACFDSAFIHSNSLYNTYVAKAQFAASLNDISNAKLNLEILVNEGLWLIPTVADIGFEASSENCSAISIDNFDAGAGSATISCIIKGNALINNKVVTWARDNSGVWSCTTNVATQYSNKLCTY